MSYTHKLLQPTCCYPSGSGCPTSTIFAAIVQTDLIHTFKSVFSSSVAWPFRQLPKIFFMTLFRMSTTVQSNFIIKTCGRDYSVNFGVRVPKFFVYLQNNIPQLFAQAIFSKTPLKLFFPVKRMPPKLPLVLLFLFQTQNVQAKPTTQQPPNT